jgi:hypothetical protein
MKSSLDSVTDVFKLLNSSPVKALISGGIYKYKRPLNSTLEDIVINSLGLNANPIQRGLVNVNIHVENLVIASNPADRSQPNTARMKVLTDAAVTTLKENWGTTEDLLIEVDNTQVFEENTHHFSNIRVLFYSLQN